MRIKIYNIYHRASVCLKTFEKHSQRHLQIKCRRVVGKIRNKLSSAIHSAHVTTIVFGEQVAISRLCSLRRAIL